MSLVAMSVLLAGCGSDDGVTPQDGAIGQQILGEWYPYEIAGYTQGVGGVAGFDKALISFDEDGTWTGSDGCNGLGGEYDVTATGAFSASPPVAMTLAGCANVPNDAVLKNATKVEMVDGVLTFSMGRKGEPLSVTGRYTREPNEAPAS